MLNSAERPVAIWFLTGAILILLMVLLGGITRLTGSGLSMAQWSLAGSRPPTTEKQWLAHFNAYKDTPEFKKVNVYYSLDDFKRIFWWEYIHRMLGRTIGFVFLIPFIYFTLKRKFPRSYFPRAILLLCVGSLQGFLGWFMVKSGLINKPHVDHLRLAAHLITALFAFSLCLWYYVDLSRPVRFMPDRRTFHYSLAVSILLVFQLILGAFVSGLKAGLTFNTFPLMDGGIMPSDVTRLNPLYLNFIFNGAGVQFLHRLLGLSILLISTTWMIHSLRNRSSNRMLVLAFWFVLCFQVTLGIITLLFQVPLIPAVIHQCTAFILFGMVLISIKAHS